MATFLFDDMIFGPVKSRRLGASLGINLLPVTAKCCNFNCIYCECGWSGESGPKPVLPLRAEIRQRLENKLRQLREEKAPLDRITFAGNGEPTIHPDFAGIIDDTLYLRNQYFPDVMVAVLSNASRLDDPEVFRALVRVDMNILKLDSSLDSTVRLLNQPPAGYRVQQVIEGMIRFNGRFILQSMFVQGTIAEKVVDNTTEEELLGWLRMVKAAKPAQVMIYTIERDTPLNTLRKVSPEKLDEIAVRVRGLGFEVQVSY
jgi:wyosine [tRNA(Phe)-imidazoG37] synthetase (radical SAM superfamily)